MYVCKIVLFHRCHARQKIILITNTNSCAVSVIVVTMAHHHHGGFLPTPCPRCDQGIYQSQRSLSLHLNNCVQSLFHTNICPPTKRSRLLPPTTAQRANDILQSMKSSHVSGTCRNVNRLSVPASNVMVANRSDSPNHDNHNIEFGNDSCYDFHEPNDDATNTTDNNVFLSFLPFLLITYPTNKQPYSLTYLNHLALL